MIRTTDIEENGLALLLAARMGHPDCVELLIPVSDPKADNSSALRVAAENGHLACVELLLPVSDPKANNRSSALRVAAENGHLACVELLLPVSEPKGCLLLAARNNHVDVVEHLLRFPVADDEAALPLMFAAEYGHTAVVEQLIPFSDFGDRMCGLRCALESGHMDCVELLLPVSIGYQLIHFLPVLSILDERPELCAGVFPLASLDVLNECMDLDVDVVGWDRSPLCVEQAKKELARRRRRPPPHRGNMGLAP
jgi:hypothetical protein